MLIAEVICANIITLTFLCTLENNNGVSIQCNIEEETKMHAGTTGGIKIEKDQLQKTRGIMEQLRRTMEEKKARRRARREARAAPYSTSWSLKSSDSMTSADDGDGLGSSSVNLQLDASSSSDTGSNGSTASSPSPNGKTTPAAQQPTTTGGNSSDIFNPELEPVTA